METKVKSSLQKQKVKLQLLKEEIGGENTPLLSSRWVIRDRGKGRSGDVQSALDNQDLQQCPSGWIVGKEQKKGQSKKTKD